VRGEICRRNSRLSAERQGLLHRNISYLREDSLYIGLRNLLLPEDIKCERQNRVVGRRPLEG